MGIASIADRGKALELKLIAEHPLSGELLVVLAEQWAGKINFQNKKDFVIRIYVDSVSKKEKIDILLEFLSQAGDLLQEEKERTLQK